MLFISHTTPDLPPDLPSFVDGIELRLDWFAEIDLFRLKELQRNAPHPLLFTLRKASHGGKFQGTEKKREEQILQLLMLAPPFFDLEGDMRTDFLVSVLKNHPKTRFILSHHDFEKTPSDLKLIYHSLMRYSPFSCKIAAMANSTQDALRMLLFAKNHPKVSVICMGEKGEFARVLGKICGNEIDYAVLRGSPSTGPNQLFAEDLVETYRYPFLDKDTTIYGLIGNPVAKSPGALHHNAVFEKKKVKAVYVKMIVEPKELKPFLAQAKKIGIRGLSVTIPLKEKIFPWIDEMDDRTRQMGAANTLLFKKEFICGINTDGSGALDAIEKRRKVKEKNVVLLGAGGAARAIAFEAFFRGARLVILNRTVAAAEKLASEVRGQAGRLNDVPFETDVLINCTPNPMPIDTSLIPSKALVMDIVIFPKETPFLTAALRRGCQVIYGEEMFLNQAERQTRFWLDNSATSERSFSLAR